MESFNVYVYICIVERRKKKEMTITGCKNMVMYINCIANINKEKEKEKEKESKMY